MHLSWSMSPLLGLSLQPPCTGNSLLVPSSRISNCFITKVTPKKQRDTTVLQERGLPDPLPFITACPRPPHSLPEYFGFLLLHPLPNRSVSNTARGVCSGATVTYCRCQKRREQPISEKTRHARDAKRKRTDAWGGWMPDLLSVYALIP